MRSGNWDTTGIVDATANITLGGVAKVGDSVSVSRDIPTPLPGQVGSVGGGAAATGSVDWPAPDDVTQRVGTPSQSGGNSHKVFTGYTDGTKGRFSDPSHSTELVDDIDKLNRPFAMGALSRIMPPPDAESQSGNIRRMIGLLPQYFTNRVIREAGFYTTPPMDGFCVASAPLVGSTWPERGTLTRSSQTGDELGTARYNPTFAWSSMWGGVGTKNVFASYYIDTSVYSGLITSSRPLNITAMFGPTHNNSGYVAASWGDGRQIRLTVSSSRTVSAQTRLADGTVNTLFSMAPPTITDSRVFTLRVEDVGNDQWKYTIRTDKGVEQSVTASRLFGGGAIDQMWVHAPDNRIGGAQLSFTSLAWTAANYTQTAWLDSPVSLVNLEAMPAIESGNCLELLRAQAEAECAAFWLDEDGVLRWKSREQFTAGNVVRTLTATDDLLDVQFRIDGQDVRRKVNVKYRAASVSTARTYSLTVYEGQRNEVRIGDEIKEWIKPDADHDWIQVDTVHDVIVGGGGTGTMNTGVGTHIGFTPMDVNNDELLTSTGFDRPMNFSQVGANSWLFTLTLNGVPAGVDRVVTKTIDNTALKPAYRNVGLPFVRARGLVSWSDQEYTPGVTGPGWASELEHDASWFVQDPGEAQALADWIAGKTANPYPVVESVDVIPDPRLQLGDKVVVDDPTLTGVRITGVITGIQQSITDGDYTMSLRLLVTLVETPNITLAEFDAWYEGMTLAQVDAAHEGRTLAQVDAAPLI